MARGFAGRSDGAGLIGGLSLMRGLVTMSGASTSERAQPAAEYRVESGGPRSASHSRVQAWGHHPSQCNLRLRTVPLCPL